MSQLAGVNGSSLSSGTLCQLFNNEEKTYPVLPCTPPRRTSGDLKCCGMPRVNQILLLITNTELKYMVLTCNSLEMLHFTC